MKFIILLSLLFSIDSKAQVSEEEFKSIADDFINFIVPLGAEVYSDYSRSIIIDPSLDYGAYSNEPMTINMGTLKSRNTTKDALINMMCHEIAHDVKIARHFLGGELEYASSHLEQDYFATKFCFRKFIHMNPRYQKIDLTTDQLEEIPIGTQTDCERENRLEIDRNICLRTVHASIKLSHGLYYDIAHLFRHFQETGIPAPSLDRELIRNNSVDFLQVRLLNMIRGALNKSPYNQ